MLNDHATRELAPAEIDILERRAEATVPETTVETNLVAAVRSLIGHIRASEGSKNQIDSESDVPTILWSFNGGQSQVSFADWAEYTVQDMDYAFSMIESMMLMPESEKQVNIEDPEFYETYSILDLELLRKQVAVCAANLEL